MFNFRYRNINGTALELGQKRPFLITSREGLEAVENEITSTTQYNLDGAELVGQRLNTRSITLKGEMLADTQEELQSLRMQMISIFNPRLSGTLEYQVEDKIYNIDVLTEIAPKFGSEQTAQTYTFTIELKALNPYWYDVTDYDKLIPLSQLQNNMTWPLKITPNYVFSKIVSGNITTVTNNGDIETGAEYTLKIGGDVKNIKVLNIVNGDFFQINYTFTTGDVVVLNTIRQKFSVKLTRSNGDVVNLIGNRELNSSFFQLNKGDNYIQVTADVGKELIIADMKFTPLVLGV